MRRLVVATVLLLAVAGCSETESAPAPEPSESAASPTAMATPTPVTPTSEPTGSSPASQTPTAPRPEPTATRAGTSAFCDYLEQTSGQQQQVEEPSQFVALVEGAAAVAPASIAEDIALYVESVRKLAETVTAAPKKAERANQWLSDNEVAVAQAEANLDSYTQSACGRPFIAGEGS